MNRFNYKIKELIRYMVEVNKLKNNDKYIIYKLINMYYIFFINFNFIN